MKRILVAVDDSAIARRAAAMAADLASRFGASLLMVHVIPPLVYPVEGYGIDLHAIEDADRQSATAFLRDAELGLAGRAIEIDKRILWGSPAETIAELATSIEADLVVVGSRGRNAAARVLLGSTSDRLVHICTKPVLVVR